jgi:hypothetical protein
VNGNKAIFYIFNSFGKLFRDACDFVIGFSLEIWSGAREKSVTPFNILYERMAFRLVADRLKGRYI